MKPSAPALRRLVRSGWVPLALTTMATTATLWFQGVSVGEIVRFGTYCTLGLVLPGLVLWRLLVSRAGGNLVADAVFGTSLALAVELVVYFSCAHLGRPEVAWLWPVLPIAGSLVRGVRPWVWRRAERQPVWWSWAVAGLLMLSVAVMARLIWASAALTSVGLRKPYVDIPYHLSLVAGLSRRVSTDLPFVEGEPLYYHWFTHAHLAAERHATGIEPIVLISRLDMLLLVGIVLLGAAAVAQRVSRSALAGLVATGVLTLGSSALLWPQFEPLFLTTLLYLSPTTPFACAILVGCIAISVELLDTDVGTPRTAWVTAIILLAASSGAKGPALPVLLAGWVSVILMALLLRRRVHWPAIGLALIGLSYLLLAKKLVYGDSAQGIGLLPFGLGSRLARSQGLPSEATGGSLGLRATVGSLYVLIRISCLIAVLGLFTRKNWRVPQAHFLVGSIVGGVGATLLLDSSTRNQVYFLLVTPVFVAAVTGWGFAELLQRVASPIGARVAVGFLAVGVATSLVLLNTPPEAFERDEGVTLVDLLTQPLVVLGLLLVLATALLVVARSRGRPWNGTASLACASLVIGLGLSGGPLRAGDISLFSPKDEAAATATVPVIGVGGISAARWLRAHSSPDAVVATNSHCLAPLPRRCDHRAFWIAGYSERQILLEGWSYATRAWELAEKEGVSEPLLPFWHPGRQRENDQAFLAPTRARLQRLHDRHGVDWLFVDKRFPVRLRALEKFADLRLDERSYAIFRIG